jgi:hypothetical protein
VPRLELVDEVAPVEVDDVLVVVVLDPEVVPRDARDVVRHRRVGHAVVAVGGGVLLRETRDVGRVRIADHAGLRVVLQHDHEDVVVLASVPGGPRTAADVRRGLGHREGTGSGGQGDGGETDGDRHETT